MSDSEDEKIRLKKKKRIESDSDTSTDEDEEEGSSDDTDSSDMGEYTTSDEEGESEDEEEEGEISKFGKKVTPVSHPRQTEKGEKGKKKDTPLKVKELIEANSPTEAGCELKVKDKAFKTKFLELFPTSLFQVRQFSGEKTVTEFLSVLTHKILNRLNKEFLTVEKRSESADEEFKVLKEHCKLFSTLFEESSKKLVSVTRENENTFSSFKKTHQETITSFRNETIHENLNKIDLISDSLKGLEEQLSEFGNNLILTGNMLSNLHAQKVRAENIKKLLDYFNMFNGLPDQPFQASLRGERQFKFDVFNDPMREKALVQVLNMLKNKIVPEIEGLDFCKQGLKNLKIFNLTFNGILTEKFEKSLQKNELRLIKKRANILFQYGQFRRSIDLFILHIKYELLEIPSHYYFIQSKLKKRAGRPSSDSDSDEDSYADEIEDDELYYDSDASDGYENDLQILESENGTSDLRGEKKRNFVIASEPTEKTVFDENFNSKLREKRKLLMNKYCNANKFHMLLVKMEAICEKKIEIVQQIYGDKKQEVFLTIFQTLINEFVKNIITVLLEMFQQKSVIDFLKKFYQIYKNCLEFNRKLVKNPGFELKEEDLKNVFDEIFLHYKNGYVDKELNYLKERSESELRSVKKTILLKDPGAEGRKPPKSKQDKRKTILEKLKRTQAKTITEIRFDVMRKIQHENEDAVNRCYVLSNNAQVSKNITLVFGMLIDFADTYLMEGLMDSIDVFSFNSDDNSKKPETGKLFNNIKLVISMMEIIQQYMDGKVLSKLKENLPESIRIVKMRHELFNSLENLITNALKEIFDAVINHIDYLIHKLYKKNDYKIIGAHVNETEYCRKCVGFLKRVFDQVGYTLFNQNKEIFLENLGLTCFYRLITFITKNVKVSQVGAVIFQQDLKRFQMFFRGFKSRKIDDKFETLKNLSGIVCVSPGNTEHVVKKLLADNINRNMIDKFMKMREDRGSKSGSKIFDQVAGVLKKTPSGRDLAKGLVRTASFGNFGKRLPKVPNEKKKEKKKQSKNKKILKQIKKGKFLSKLGLKKKKDKKDKKKK